MEDLTSDKDRQRYLLSNGVTGQGLFVVEAQDEAQAITRGALVQASTGLWDKEVVLEAQEWSVPVALPHFLEGYFALVEHYPGP